MPPHGGFLVARAETRDELDTLLAAEPFVREEKMVFTRVTEFEVAQSQPLLTDWFSVERT